MQRTMNLPSHLRADIRDGMNPDLVYAVHCIRCEEYVGDYRKLIQEGFDVESGLLCGKCTEEFQERISNLEDFYKECEGE